MSQTVLEMVFSHYGSASALAAKIGISRQAVFQWRVVPLKYVKMIEADTGISREKLRPDIYG